MMALLPDDQKYLDKRNFDYDIKELGNETLIILKNYKISSSYDLDKTNVLIRIPNGYPMAQLDMFWVYPYIKIKEKNTYPTAADYFGEIFNGHNWQRFSRHYSWKPNYTLSTHLNVIKDVLVNGRA